LSCLSESARNAQISQDEVRFGIRRLAFFFASVCGFLSKLKCGPFFLPVVAKNSGVISGIGKGVIGKFGPLIYIYIYIFSFSF
jgi:hypothetical protein